jgi:hypothetical protein
LSVIILILGSCHSQATPTPTTTEARYFPETGLTVQGDFLRFFDTYGGVDSFGYPLTEEIVVDGWRVQYFEKSRLEYHPENEPAYHVVAGWLGDLLRRRRPPLPSSSIPPLDDPHRRYFPQTGHTLSGDFLDYFETHGGSVRFGLPISEPFLWKGRLTQDFQSARFFWTPDAGPPVTLEDIGRIHLKVRGLDGSY